MIEENNIRNRYNSLIKLIRSYDEHGRGVKSTDPNESGERLFKEAILFYLCYLAFSNGKISQSEVDYINKFCKNKWHIPNYVNIGKVLYEEDWGNHIPTFFMYLADDDESMFYSIDDYDIMLSSQYTLFLELLGNDFIATTQDNDTATKAMNKHISRLKDYQYKNISICRQMAEFTHSTTSDLQRATPTSKSTADLRLIVDQYHDLSNFLNTIGETYPDLFAYEIQSYICHLAGSDGTITEQELAFLNSICDKQWNMGFFNRVVEQVSNDISYKSKVPFIFQEIIDYENSNSSTSISWSDCYIQFLETIGNELISCDNEISDKEIHAMADYIIILMEYKNSNVRTVNVESSSSKEESNDGGRDYSNENKLNNLYSLVGLHSVKEEVSSLINLIKVRKIREEKGIAQPALSLHLVFSGNPGTGKTTVARILAEIYHDLGILSKGHLVEVDRSGLVAGYVGQTAIKTQEKIKEALGGILFIDEAYTLVKDGQDFGQEAIDTILKAMEDHRDDLIIIVAGYTDLINTFLNSNPGLMSRFNKYIEFPDYNPTELYEILESLCIQNGFKLDDDCREYLKAKFIDIYNSRTKNFANGRTVRNLFENAMTNQANRIALQLSGLSDDELMTFIKEDFE